ncbi:MAG: hypothetical protein Q8Q97_01460 [bacterium]|nr:hypothetical protein [bacterium]
MPRLAEREENILGFIIRDYIREASPVSSGRVAEDLKPEVSPATIRNVMLELGREGYLEQPHTSAGRVPTDKAYRYFVDFLMEYREPAHGFTSAEDFFSERFSRVFSEEFGLFTGLANFGRHARVFGFGLEKVLKEPEFEDHGLSLELANLADNLDKFAENVFEKAREFRPEVFIGGENPYKKARDLSAAALKFKSGKHGGCLIFSVGPKRMNYEKISSLLDFISKDLTKRHG